MPKNKETLALAAALVGKLLETPAGHTKLSLLRNGDEAMKTLGQRVKALAQALSDNT